jgi:hypothetical protein
MPRLHPTLLLVALVGCGSDDPCDPNAQTGCDDGQVCENVSGGEPACFAPVAIEGRVFDLSSQAGIANARVVAVDVNGAAVSNVVTSKDDGTYKLPIPTDRNKDGTPVSLEGNLTLRADAQSYESFPGTVREPLPIDISTATKISDGDDLVVKSALTDIAMSKAADGGSAGRIEGTVEVPEGVTGIVVVAEANGTGYATIAARNGEYAILNVPAGSYTVTAYAVDHNYLGGSAEVANNTAKLDIKLSGDAASPINGQVSIVDGGGATATSIVLFIESTYDPLTGRGVTVPGLRAPRTGVPDVTGAFTMEGVPAGKYVIVAAFENDGLVRDPDLCQAGTDDVHIEVAANAPLAIPDAFKITGALRVIDPGAMGVQAVTTGVPTFSWADDSSEDQYLVELFDSYGERVWMKTMAGVSGGTPSMAYDGPALLSGMYYQFRTTSSRTSGSTRCNISRTEDLKGVFYLP